MAGAPQAMRSHYTRKWNSPLLLKACHKNTVVSLQVSSVLICFKSRRKKNHILAPSSLICSKWELWEGKLCRTYSVEQIDFCCGGKLGWGLEVGKYMEPDIKDLVFVWKRIRVVFGFWVTAWVCLKKQKWAAPRPTAFVDFSFSSSCLGWCLWKMPCLAAWPGNLAS